MPDLEQRNGETQDRHEVARDKSFVRGAGSVAGGAMLGAAIGGPVGAFIGAGIGFFLGQQANRSNRGNRQDENGVS